VGIDGPTRSHQHVHAFGLVCSSGNFGFALPATTTETPRCQATPYQLVAAVPVIASPAVALVPHPPSLPKTFPPAPPPPRSAALPLKPIPLLPVAVVAPLTPSHLGQLAAMTPLQLQARLQQQYTERARSTSTQMATARAESHPPPIMGGAATARAPSDNSAAVVSDEATLRATPIQTMPTRTESHTAHTGRAITARAPSTSSVAPVTDPLPDTLRATPFPPAPVRASSHAAQGVGAVTARVSSGSGVPLVADHRPATSRPTPPQQPLLPSLGFLSRPGSRAPLAPMAGARVSEPAIAAKENVSGGWGSPQFTYSTSAVPHPVPMAQVAIVPHPPPTHSSSTGVTMARPRPGRTWSGKPKYHVTSAKNTHSKIYHANRARQHALLQLAF
jgi:hypothetical protein